MSTGGGRGVAQWVGCSLRMNEALGLIPSIAYKPGTVACGNSSAQEARQKDQEFKVILGYMVVSSRLPWDTYLGTCLKGLGEGAGQGSDRCATSSAGCHWSLTWATHPRACVLPDFFSVCDPARKAGGPLYPSCSSDLLASCSQSFECS